MPPVTRSARKKKPQQQQSPPQQKPRQQPRRRSASPAPRKRRSDHNGGGGGGGGGGGEKDTSLATAIYHVFENLFHNVFRDARNSGLPWSGMQCRSLIAGGTGVLYALPALACPSAGEKCLWAMQATCSVAADYFNIHHPSYWHGLDRVVATLMTLRAIVLVSLSLRPWVIVFAMVPLSWFFAGSRAKKADDLEAWKRCHCGWHISGSLIVLITTSLTNYCGSGGGSTPFVRGAAASFPLLAAVADASCPVAAR